MLILQLSPGLLPLPPGLGGAAGPPHVGPCSPLVAGGLLPLLHGVDDLGPPGYGGDAAVPPQGGPCSLLGAGCL